MDARSRQKVRIISRRIEQDGSRGIDERSGREFKEKGDRNKVVSTYLIFSFLLLLLLFVCVCVLHHNICSCFCC